MSLLFFGVTVESLDWCGVIAIVLVAPRCVLV
jgi:hypothetical protein